MSLIRNLRKVQEENKALKEKISDLEDQIQKQTESEEQCTSQAKIDHLKRSLSLMISCYETTLEHLALSITSNIDCKKVRLLARYF